MKLLQGRVFVCLLLYCSLADLLGSERAPLCLVDVFFDSFGIVNFLGVDFFSCMELDCSGGVLVIFCFYLRDYGYRLLICSSDCICPSLVTIMFWKGETWG